MSRVNLSYYAYLNLTGFTIQLYGVREKLVQVKGVLETTLYFQHIYIQTLAVCIYKGFYTCS